MDQVDQPGLGTSNWCESEYADSRPRPCHDFFDALHLLHYHTRWRTKKLKEGENQKTKTYHVLCIVPGGDMELDEIKSRLNPIRDLELEHKTPIRVLHRRPNELRMRTIYWTEVGSGRGAQCGASTIVVLLCAGPPFSEPGAVFIGRRPQRKRSIIIIFIIFVLIPPCCSCLSCQRRLGRT